MRKSLDSEALNNEIFFKQEINLEDPFMKYYFDSVQSELDGRSLPATESLGTPKRS